MITEAFSHLYFKKEIFEDLNISTLPSSNDFIISSKVLANFDAISIQISYKDLTGTLNGVFKVQQRNDSTLPLVDIPTLTTTLSSATSSVILETSEFLGESVAVNFTKGGITG
ncbi:MAG: hypothetical protein OEL54_06530, partial [Flavobacteriaceae bacterium]|nr:hypothetical protein [Flavobacteriaceae bacterium]